MKKRCSFACGEFATRFGLRIVGGKVDLCKRCFDLTIGRKKPDKSQPRKRRDLPAQKRFDFRD